jgi:hypothetical protein
MDSTENTEEPRYTCYIVCRHLRCNRSCYKDATCSTLA